MRSRVWTPWTHTNGGWEGETRKGDPQSKLGSRAVSRGFGWKTDSVNVLEEQRKRTLVINVGSPHTHTHMYMSTHSCAHRKHGHAPHKHMEMEKVNQTALLSQHGSGKKWAETLASCVVFTFSVVSATQGAWRRWQTQQNRVWFP